MTDMADRVISQEFFLSPRTKVLIFFDGDAPDGPCFKNLRSFIDLMERTLSSEKPASPARKKPALGPCEKHPNGTRRENGRRDCEDCLKENAQLMVEARNKRRLKAS
jgi:hypothetical protein